MSSRDTFTAEVPKQVLEDGAYAEWEDQLDGSLLIKVQAARDKIESDGIITSAKDLGDGLYEKKWNSGLRLYFAIVESQGKKTLLLLGSGKGRSQEKAIEQSKKNLSNYSVVRDNIVKKD
jgi:putative component of toxin-antitoxin plasmid stabilization module